MKFLGRQIGRIRLLLRGLALFKDWDIWLMERFRVRYRGRRRTFRLRGGVSFAVDFSRHSAGTFQEVWLMDLYEREYRIRPGDRVVDIGASFGPFAVLAASRGAKVFAYEPTPGSFALLEKNCEGRDITARRAAVAAKAGRATVYLSPGGDEGNTTSAAHAPAGAEKISVPAVTLGQVMEEAGPCDFLKMDCEGSELEIIKSGASALRQVKRIALEYHKNKEAVEAALSEAGFRTDASGGEYGYIYARRRDSDESAGKPMKIAIVNYNLKWEGGGQRLLYELARALEAKGHTVHVYAPETEYDPKAYAEVRGGIAVRAVPAPYPYMWTPPYDAPFSMRLWYKFRKERWLRLMGRRMAEAMREPYDVINLHDFAYWTAYYCRKLGKPGKIVWTMNDPPPYIYLPHPESRLYDFLSRAFNRLKDFTERPAFRAVDCATVLNRFSVRWIESRGMKARIARPGVSFEKFFQPVKDFSARAERREVRLMGMGILNPYRGYETLIEAVRILRSEGYEATAKIIARDFWKKDWLRQGLLDQVSRSKLERFVTLNFEGEPEAGVRETYRQSDVFVLSIHLPPPRDGFGWQLIGVEAMASGLPLVISRKNDVTEVLKDGETALFYEPQDPESIAEKVKFLVAHPEEYRKIAQAAQDFVKKNLTWQNYVEDMIAAFKS